MPTTAKQIAALPQPLKPKPLVSRTAIERATAAAHLSMLAAIHGIEVEVNGVPLPLANLYRWVARG
jgi:hypothetical protein